MTDNEIIKALECCHNEDCDNCPLSKYPKGICRCDAYDYAFNLIKRQKAEIETFANLGKLYHEVYSEAIKEFIKKLKDNSFYCDVSFGYGKENYQEAVSMIEVERIAKEMVGEENA